MNAPPSVPLFAADRPHSKCSRRFFHFQFLLIGKAFTEPRVQRVVLLIQKDKEIVFSLSFLAIAGLFYSPMNMFHHTPWKRVPQGSVLRTPLRQDREYSKLSARLSHRLQDSYPASDSSCHNTPRMGTTSY